jgi:hypothetical protein
VTFPVGATLLGGDVRIMEHLRGGPEAGQYMAIGPKGACLVTTSSPITLPYSEAEARLRLALPGVSPLWFVGPVESNEGPHDALVEALPRGKPGDRLGSLSVNNAIALATTVAHDLAHAHTLGAVYGGLRPELVFVDEQAPVTVRVAPRCETWLDLGGARKEGALVFERLYAAPEQLKTGRASAPADVFALGATLAFWLGAAPFGRGHRSEQLEAIVSGKPDLSALPAELATLIARTLALDPTKRPSAAELRDALRVVSAR